MISAKEDTLIFVRLSKGDRMEDLQGVIENYRINSGVFWGFGKLKSIETEEETINLGECTIYGTISEMKGKPKLEVFVQSDKKIGYIKDLFSDDFTLVIKKFQEIKMISMLNEKAELELSIGEKSS